MSDSVDRQEAIEAAIEAVDEWDGGCDKDRERMITWALLEVPSTNNDSEGRWIYGENEYGLDGWTCPECGHFILWDYRTPQQFTVKDLPVNCPNCNTRMR